MRQGRYGESGCSNIGAGPAGLMAGKELAEEIGGGPGLVVGAAYQVRRFFIAFLKGEHQFYMIILQCCLL